MRGWRSKLIFLLIIYFAGFVTAIYCLAPVPKNQASQADQKSFAYSILKSDEFAKSFSRGLHKCIDFAKDATKQAGTYVKDKMDQHQDGG